MDDIEARMSRLEYEMWGLRGDNGVVSEIHGLADEFEKWRVAETQRRLVEADKARSRDRAIMLTAVSSAIGLLGIVATLLVVLGGGL